MFDIFSVWDWIKKNLNRKDLLLAIILITIYFATRLINLDKFPIFNDEGIYIRWAKVAWHDATWRFISLTDGKQPLQTWGTIPFLKLLPNNALLAGRLFSVATGLIGLAGMFSMLFYLFGKKTAFIGSFLYIFTPYFLFYDRMAMVDSGVNAGFIWMLFLSILLAKNIRLDTALIFAMVSGISLLAKSSVRLFVGLSALAPILFLDKNWRKNVFKLINFYFLFIISVFLAIIIYNIQRLSPFFHFVAEKNKTFVMTFSEFVKTPFANFFNNIKIIPIYVFSELGWIVVIFALLGLVILFKKDKKLSLYLVLWLVISYILVAFVSKVLFPRYLIFFGTIIVIFASYFLSSINKREIILPSVLLLLIFNGYFIYMILFNFTKIPFPEVDRGQYIDGITAGWGIKDIIDYARMRSSEKQVTILAEGDFGMTGDVMDVFLLKNDKIFIKGYWPLEKKNLVDNQPELNNRIILAVFAHRQDFPADWPLKLIKIYPKPSAPSAPSIHLFELTK